MTYEKLDYFSTKDASKVLEISVSSMRLYAQRMEAMGYKFKTIDNARRFNKYDLLLISKAMKRFKLVGGKMEESLHYMIIADREGEERAQRFIDDMYSDPQPKQKEEQLNGEEIAKAVSSMMLDESQRYYNILNDKLNELEKQNNLQLALDNWKEKYHELKDEKTKLEIELHRLSLMNYRQFKNWKKKQEEIYK